MDHGDTAFALRDRIPAPGEPGAATIEREAPIRARPPRIRCPQCAWQPDGGKHWFCEQCFARFDTFATRARCPECPNRWRLTECIRCGVLSPHEDWYEAERPTH